MSIIDVCRKVERERNARTVFRFAPKNKSSEQRSCRSSARTHTGTRTMLPDTNWDEHWHTAFSSFTCHSISNSLRWICSLKIHSATRRQNPIPIFAWNSICITLCMFGESVFALIPDHEVRAAKLTNRWISGCWWGRDASSDEHLVVTKHGLLKCRSVRRKPPGEQWSRLETIEARGTKWNFDVEMDSGIPGSTLEPRRDEGMATPTAAMEIPTVPSPAPPPEEYVFEMQVHSNSGGGDVAAKTRLVIYDPSCADLAKTKVIDKVVRYTNILETPIPVLLSVSGKLIDTGQIIIAQKLQGLKNDIYVTMVSWWQRVTSKDRYITFVSTVLMTAVTYLGFEYRSVHDGYRRGFTVKPDAKYVDECLDIVQLQYAKAAMTPLTEQKSLNLHDETTACDQVQHSLFRAVVGKLQYITGETRFDFRDKMLLIQTCVTNTCRLDTCQESVEIFERNTRTESLPDDTCIETKWLEQDFKTRHGIFWRWLGRWSSDEEKHILHTVLRWSISLDEWMSRTGDCCLVQSRVRNVRSWCTVSWVDFRTSYTEINWTIIPDTRESRQQHSTRSGNETWSKS